MDTLVAAVIILAVIVAGVLIYAATRPDAFVVKRSLVIDASPQKLFGYINDFRNWPEWSPYEGRDPNMKRTLSGEDEGVGAVYVWEGDKQVGTGRMEILESRPPSDIVIRLDFERPFEAHNMTEFTLAPVGASTNVTWAMRGLWPYMAKLMGMFMNMDRMIGKDFEIGLLKLKDIAERR